MSDVHAVQALVPSWRDFSECILDAIERQISEQQSGWPSTMSGCRTVQFARMPIRGTLAVTGVEEVHILNRLTPTQQKDMSRLNWGFAEISQVLIRASPSAGSSSLILEVWRESGIWILVRCADLITESQKGPRIRE